MTTAYRQVHRTQGLKTVRDLMFKNYQDPQRYEIYIKHTVEVH